MCVYNTMCEKRKARHASAPRHPLGKSEANGGNAKGNTALAKKQKAPSTNTATTRTRTRTEQHPKQVSQRWALLEWCAAQIDRVGAFVPRRLERWPALKHVGVFRRIIDAACVARQAGGKKNSRAGVGARACACACRGRTYEYEVWRHFFTKATRLQVADER